MQDDNGWRHSGPDPESLWREILNRVQDDRHCCRMTMVGVIPDLIRNPFVREILNRSSG